MPDRHVVVVGAGIGGLASALLLAAAGLRVTVLERAAAPGGKMRQVMVGGAPIDAGPTVFTMRWVFDALFADAGAALDDHLTLRPVERLARHAWVDGARLDLFADLDRSADAIGAFAGPEAAAGYRTFAARSRRTYEILREPFIRAPRPSAVALALGAGLGDMTRIAPFDTLWQALGAHFSDPRLRQLFGRYATYTGSSPFLAPATLMLIAHVEAEGVWLVEGGMHRVARAFADVAGSLGASFRYGAEVARITTTLGRADGVALADGECIAADAVVLNADAAALPAGLFGARVARAVPPTPDAARSLSALTWCLLARARGFPLLRHTVFFSDDYAAEFDTLAAGRLPAHPTVYVCAQDRADDGAEPDGDERLLVLSNAPPAGDRRPFDTTETGPCETATFDLLRRCGLSLEAAQSAMTTPADFSRLFPATGGALYGQATHGAMASFRRPGARTKVPRLYLAGGSAHPGAGVPMAALSGRQAASALMADLGSTPRSRATATFGGTSTR